MQRFSARKSQPYTVCILYYFSFEKQTLDTINSCYKKCCRVSSIYLLVESDRNNPGLKVVVCWWRYYLVKELFTGFPKKIIIIIVYNY